MKSARVLAKSTFYAGLSEYTVSPFQEKYDAHKYTFKCQHGEQECLANMIAVKLQTKCTDFECFPSDLMCSKFLLFLQDLFAEHDK